MLGGELDWAGILIVAELHGISDIEKLIRQLIAIRDKQARDAKA